MLRKQTVWKFALTPEGPHFPAHRIVTIKMPSDAQYLCVKVIAGRPYIWVLTEGECVPTEERWFLLLGTGNTVLLDTNTAPFVDTYINDEGSLVNHVFALPKPEADTE